MKEASFIGILFLLMIALGQCEKKEAADRQAFSCQMVAAGSRQGIDVDGCYAK